MIRIKVDKGFTQWDKNRAVKVMTDEDIRNLECRVANLLDKQTITCTAEPVSKGIYTVTLPDSVFERDGTLCVWVTNNEYTVSEEFRFPIMRQQKPDNYEVTEETGGDTV